MIPIEAIRRAAKPRDDKENGDKPVVRNEYGYVAKPGISSDHPQGDSLIPQIALGPLYGVEDADIDCRGLTISSDNRKRPVLTILNCKRVRITGLTLGYDGDEDVAVECFVQSGNVTGSLPFVPGCFIRLDASGNYIGPKVSTEDVTDWPQKLNRLHAVSGRCLAFRKRTGNQSTIRIENCEDISLVNCCVSGGLQMGIGAVNTTGLLIDSCKIGSLSGAGNRADGIHLQYCREVFILNNIIMGCGDDGANICSPLRDSADGMLEPYQTPDYPGMWIDLARFSARFTIEDNTFHRLPRGMLLQAAHGTVRGNTFRNIIGPHIIVGRDDGVHKCGIPGEAIRFE